MKIFFLVMILMTGSSCSIGVTKCLETPISSKVSANTVETCKAALEANPNRQDLFHIYLGLLRVRGQYDEIETWSQRILEKDPGRTDAIYNLAFALRKKGNCSEAIKQYQTYAAANSEDPDPYYGLGLCFENQGNTEQARQSYQAYITREKRSSQQEWIANAQARIQALNNNPLATATPPKMVTPVSSAVPSPSAPPTVRPVSSPSAPKVAIPAKPADCAPFEAAFIADPFSLEAYDKFAVCAFQAGRYSDIVKRIRVALRDNPDFHKGWMHLGKALKALGDLTQSKIALAKACSAGVAEACGL